MDCRTPSFPVLHYLSEFAQIHIHLSWWYYLTISSSAGLSFCFQSFPASKTFPMSQLFKSSDQSIRVSASASVFSMNIDFPYDWFDLLAVQRTLKSFLQHHSLKASTLWCSVFFMFQLSHPYMTTGKTIALTIWTFIGKVISLLFNTLSRFVIAFLPRSPLISWLQSPSVIILEPKKVKFVTVSTFPPSIWQEVMKRDAWLGDLVKLK